MFVASFVLLSNCFLPNPHGDLLYDSSPLSDWLGTSNPIEAADGGRERHTQSRGTGHCQWPRVLDYCRG